MTPSLHAGIATNFTKWLAKRDREQRDWHGQAGALRDAKFGQQVFVRAVIEVSNFCRENCSYCGMRRNNRSLNRFRLELEVLRKIVFEQLPNSVTDINFQTGEDPVAVREIIIPLVRQISEQTNLGVSVCLGTLDQKCNEELRAAGADFYIIKLETGNADHYKEIQAPGTFQERVSAIKTLASAGWFVSSGFIYGLPSQTEAHIAETLDRLTDLPLVGVSVSPFIPGSETPNSHQPSADLENTLNLVALLRMLSPERIIPAVSAMTILHQDGYERALRAGANLATINLTPKSSREDYLLYKKDRSIMDEIRVLSAIASANLVPSKVSLVQYLKSIKN